MLAGDFNVISEPRESLISCDYNNDMCDFNDLRSFVAIFYHHHIGFLFTWSSKH